MQIQKYMLVRRPLEQPWPDYCPINSWWSKHGLCDKQHLSNKSVQVEMEESTDADI